MCLVVVAACTAAQGPGASPDSSPSGSTPGVNADTLAFRITSEGGFAGTTFDLMRLPDFTVLADGRVIVPAPVDARYPGPLLHPLQVRRLTDQGLATLVEAVRATNVFDADHTYTAAHAVVFDAPTAVFTLVSGGSRVTVRVYALGILDSLDRVPDVTAEEARAHAALLDLSRAIGSLDALVGSDGWVDGGWQPFAPPALRLLVREADPAAQPSQPAADERPWPARDGPATGGSAYGNARCLVADGEAAAAWLRSLDGATALTRFVADGRRYAVTVRPLLPDEPVTCPTAG